MGVSTRSWIQPKINPRSTLDQPKINPRSTQNQPKINPKATQNQPKFNPSSTHNLSLQRLLATAVAYTGWVPPPPRFTRKLHLPPVDWGGNENFFGIKIHRQNPPRKIILFICFATIFRLFSFLSLSRRVRWTLASMKKRFQFSLNSHNFTQIHSILLQISTASPFFSKITPPAV